VNREKIKTNYDGKDFEFIAVLILVEERRVKQEAVRLIGGFEQYASLEAAIKSAYAEHIKFNEKKYGVEVYKEKQSQLLKLQDENSKEFIELFSELSNNRHYMKFTELIKTKVEIDDFAYLIVSCVEPENFNFDDKSEKFMRGLLGSIEVSRSKFLKKKEDSSD
jgi:hypothetical protein